jgi:hypothetical protein
MHRAPPTPGFDAGLAGSHERANPLRTDRRVAILLVA